MGNIICGVERDDTVFWWTLAAKLAGRNNEITAKDERIVAVKKMLLELSKPDTEFRKTITYELNDCSRIHDVCNQAVYLGLISEKQLVFMFMMIFT